MRDWGAVGVLIAWYEQQTEFEEALNKYEPNKLSRVETNETKYMFGFALCMESKNKEHKSYRKMNKYYTDTHFQYSLQLVSV